MRIETVRDADVDGALDAELRALLSLCFTKPQDIVFRDRRWFREPPARRWFSRNETGLLIAHVAVHDKAVLSGGRRYAIGGIAEVCVHPSQRGRGWVRRLLEVVHDALRADGASFAVLFGNPDVYASSGYRLAPNLTVRDDATGAWQATPHGQARVLGAEPWPADEVRLVGPRF